MLYCTSYTSPIGNLLLTSDGNALTGLQMDTQAPPKVPMEEKDGLALFLRTKAWLDEYFQGQNLPIGFPLSPAGTIFQQQVWDILLTIPYGQTMTYGFIAKAISPAMSAQAVGQAVGKNPIEILIPCHRCMGAGNKLTGYAAGLDKKQWLLQHEGVKI